MMNVTRKSVLTGKVRTKNIALKAEDLKLYEGGSVSINDAMPYLNSSDREFIMVGITNREWRDAFSADLKEIVNDRFGGNSW